MRHVFILVTISLTIGLLFTASSGVLKGQAFAYQAEERDNYYYPDEYLQGYDRGYYKEPYHDEYLQGYDEDPWYVLDKEFLDGVDKEVLLNIALNLLKGLDVDTLNEELLNNDDYDGYYYYCILVLFVLLAAIADDEGSGTNVALTLALFILSVIIGAGFSGGGG